MRYACRMVRAFLTALILLAAPPAEAFRQDRLCIEVLEFLDTRPPDDNRETWLGLAGFYAGMAAGVELLHPGAREQHESVAARLKATCEAHPFATVDEVLKRLVGDGAADRDARAEADRRRIAELSHRTRELQARLDEGEERLAAADAELTAMTLALEEQRPEAEETLTLLAAARAAQRAAEAEAAANLTDAERRAALLASANLALEQEEARSAESARQAALLNEQVAQLRRQLGELQALLDDSVARDAEAQVEIQALGSRLNAALARVAIEERRRGELEQELARIAGAERDEGEGDQ